MHVALTQLKPNPYRDFTVDPIDVEAVSTIKDSILEDGFWGGVVVRQNKVGEFEIAAGHHRVNAAIEAGIKSADLFVGDIDDAAMIRIYARENASQRGNGSTAVAGTVASAVRYLSKSVVMGNFSHNPNGGPRIDAGEFGWKVILDFLDAVPGVNEGSVKAQLANLKASGDYARIIREVQAEVDAEVAAEQERLRLAAEQEERDFQARVERAKQEAEASERRAKEAERRAEEAKRKAEEAAAKAEESERLAQETAARAAESERLAEEAAKKVALKRAEEEARIREERQQKLAAEAAKFDALRVNAKAAADKASEREVTFDFEGVAKWLKNENQVRVFREVATSDGVRPYLPVENQAEVARQLVEKAAAQERELSGAFIKESFHLALWGVRCTEKQMKDSRAKADLERMEWQQKWHMALREFSRHARGLSTAAAQIHDLQKSRPKDEPTPITGEFRTALNHIQFASGKLTEHNLA